MAQTYRYQAKDNRGEIVRGTIRAESEGQAYQAVAERGYFLMSLELEKAQSEKKVTEPKSFFFRKFSAFQSAQVSSGELANFFEQLSILLASGFPILKTLEFAKKASRHQALVNAVDQIIKDVQGGSKLSEAVANFPTIFPPTVTGAIQAGEASGKLDYIFSELAKSFELEAELKDQISQALMYPGFVLVLSVATVFIVMTFVIPKLMVFYETWDQELPFLTKILLGISTLFTHGLGAILIIGLILAFFTWKRFDRSKKMSLVAGLTKQVPFIQSLLFLADFVPLCRTWGLLLNSGVPILDSIKIAEGVVGDIRMRKALHQVTVRVTQGSSLSESLSETHAFPELAINFLSVGEESGDLGGSFQRVTTYYEKELSKKLKLMNALLGPILILLLGVGVCFIILSLLLPIFEINFLAQ